MRALIILLLVSWAVSAQAEGMGGRGIGTYTCGQFAQMYKNNIRADDEFFTWAQGFMTGLNVASGREFTRDFSSPLENQKGAIRRYCDGHPLGGYADAVIELWKNLPRLQPTN